MNDAAIDPDQVPLSAKVTLHAERESSSAEPSVVHRAVDDTLVDRRGRCASRGSGPRAPFP